MPTLAYGDAIGNETFALRDYIKNLGYETSIYAENVQAPLSKKEAYSTDKMPDLTSDDIGIYHLSTGSKLTYEFAKLTCKKVIIYHNITPPVFFENYEETIRRINKWGLEGVAFLADKVDYCIADSDYNKKELIDMGYQCPIDVLPILIPFSDYEKEADISIVRKYQEGKTNILFTGRIVPNKNFQDVIRTFAYYKKYYDKTARLFLVGNQQNTPVYYEILKEYVAKLGVEDVYFTGHIKFNQILSYFRIADIFLCLSKHEGFCVPLVEAMYFNIPIIAAATSAIPYTLGNSGILVDEKDTLCTAGVIDRVIKDKQLREAVLTNQRARLQDFSYENVTKQFRVILDRIIGA